MSLSDFEVIQTLGEGAYSKVYKVRRMSDGIVYALKKVPMQKLKQKEKVNAVNEVRILASVNHPNVVAYKEAFFDELTCSLCIVMEYADCGDLFQRILSYQKKGTYMAESFIWNCLIQLTRGLKALHDLSILHRDLKSANVFLTSTDQVQIGDLNVSKVAKEGLLYTQTGTPYYASPEVWKDQPYDTKSDIWSLGCVIYEAASLKPPFRAENMKSLYKRVISGEYPQLPKPFSSDLQTVIAALLSVNPRQRPSCEEILEMPQVSRRLKADNQPVWNNKLLKTIRVTGNSQSFVDSLPAPAYDASVTEPAEHMHTRRRRSEYSTGLSPSKRNQSSLSPALLNVQRRQIMKEQYGALRLPKLSIANYGNRYDFPIQTKRTLKPVSLRRPKLHV